MNASTERRHNSGSGDARLIRYESWTIACPSLFLRRVRRNRAASSPVIGFAAHWLGDLVKSCTASKSYSVAFRSALCNPPVIDRCEPNNGIRLSFVDDAWRPAYQANVLSNPAEESDRERPARVAAADPVRLVRAGAVLALFRVLFVGDQLEEDV